tara:strand:+ start:159 stop:320 length:162 start_codon:yes stop_codon:yes gene_type:complete
MSWTDERRQAHSERLKKAWADKKAREDLQAWRDIGGKTEPWWKPLVALFRKGG